MNYHIINLQGTQQKMLVSLCKQHTHLFDSEIEILLELEQFLRFIGEAQGCDVFIDCMTSDPDKAIVVGEYRPENSAYDNNVVGMYATRTNEPAALRTLETGLPTRGLKGLNQENKAIIQNVSAIENKEGQVIGVLIFERDETDVFNKEFLAEGQKSVSNNDPEPRARDVSITQYLDDAVLYFNNEGTVIYVNLKATTLFEQLGYKDTLAGMSFENLVLGPITIKSIIEKKYIEIPNLAIGSHIFKVKYHTIADHYSDLGIAMIIKDLTDIHNIERKLILKTVDIREIHHRVKNNLQTIASLLRLQARRLEESKEKRILQENINRIISIAFTHEILAQNGEDDVYIKDIIQKLVTYLSQSALPSHSKIEIILEGDDVLLRSEIATSVSLVINELIQNSFEHAFNTKEKKNGQIRISIQLYANNVEIIVSDDGTGFDPTVEQDKSLGLVIVRSMIEEKLSGTFSIESSSSGTKVTLVFSTISHFNK